VGEAVLKVPELVLLLIALHLLLPLLALLRGLLAVPIGVLPVDAAGVVGRAVGQGWKGRQGEEEKEGGLLQDVTS